jgi:hypothetical protein
MVVGEAIGSPATQEQPACRDCVGGVNIGDEPDVRHNYKMFLFTVKFKISKKLIY